MNYNKNILSNSKILDDLNYANKKIVQGKLINFSYENLPPLGNYEPLKIATCLV